MTKERGGGSEREGESIFKTKDRLGDNEWCKPDDLLGVAQNGHTFIHGLFFCVSSSSLYAALSPPGPDRLIKTEKKIHLCGPKCFCYIS